VGHEVDLGFHEEVHETYYSVYMSAYYTYYAGYARPTPHNMFHRSIPLATQRVTKYYLKVGSLIGNVHYMYHYATDRWTRRAIFAVHFLRARVGWMLR
jgi:hypothetical protein